MSQKILNMLAIEGVTEQLRLAYSPSVYTSFTIDNTGALNLSSSESVVSIYGNFLWNIEGIDSFEINLNSADEFYGFSITGGPVSGPQGFFSVTRASTTLSLDAELHSISLSSVDHISLSSEDAILFDVGTNYGFGTSFFDATAVGVLSIANGTAPAAHVDNTIQIFSVDSSENKATLGLTLEQDVAPYDGGTTYQIEVLLNGTKYYLLLTDGLDPV